MPVYTPSTRAIGVVAAVARSSTAGEAGMDAGQVEEQRHLLAEAKHCIADLYLQLREERNARVLGTGPAALPAVPRLAGGGDGDDGGGGDGDGDGGTAAGGARGLADGATYDAPTFREMQLRTGRLMDMLDRAARGAVLATGLTGLAGADAGTTRAGVEAPPSSAVARTATVTEGGRFAPHATAFVHAGLPAPHRQPGRDVPNLEQKLQRYPLAQRFVAGVESALLNSGPRSPFVTTGT